MMVSSTPMPGWYSKMSGGQWGMSTTWKQWKVRSRWEWGCKQGRLTRWGAAGQGRGRRLVKPIEEQVHVFTQVWSPTAWESSFLFPEMVFRLFQAPVMFHTLLIMIIFKLNSEWVKYQIPLNEKWMRKVGHCIAVYCSIHAACTCIVCVCVCSHVWSICLTEVF